MSENIKPWDLPDKVIERVTANEMFAISSFFQYRVSSIVISVW